MPINIKIIEKTKKQNTFEDVFEDNFINERKLENMEIETIRTNYDKYSGIAYNASNHIAWLGYNDNNFEYVAKQCVTYNLDDSIWDFNRDIFLYGMRYLRIRGSKFLLKATNKIQILANDINSSYKKQNMISKEKFLNFIEENAMLRMSSLMGNNEYENYIINTKDEIVEDKLDEDFVKIVSLESLESIS